MTSLTSLHDTPAAAHAAVPEDRTSLRGALVFTVLVLLGFGLLYSLVGALLGRALFPYQATGSLVTVDGRVRVSTLVAQPFADARYFQPRPSAAGYDPMAAAGSNLARSNPELRKRIDGLIHEVARREGIAPGQVPAELVTQSGSGLDPHLSPAAVQVQVARVAKARGLDPSEVEVLVREHTQGATFGVLGAPRVNVLQLNLALDRLHAR